MDRTLMTLDYLDFDYSEEPDGNGSFDAMASVGPQQLRVVLPGVDLGRDVGVGRQIGFKRTAITFQQLVVDVGMQIAFAGGQADHLSIRRAGLVISPSLS